MGNERDSNDLDLEKTVQVDASDDLEELKALAARLNMPADKGTVKLSPAKQRAAAEQRAVPFGGSKTPPAKLTAAEHAAMKAQNFEGTVALAAPAPPPPATPPPQSPPRTSAPRTSAARTSEAEAVALEPGEEKSSWLDGHASSSQAARTRARHMAELATTEDDELPAFVKRRAATLGKDDVGRIRDMLTALTTALDGIDDKERKQLEAAFALLLPLARRGIIAGSVLAFARSLGEFGATITFAGNIPGETQTLPLAVFSAMNRTEPSPIKTKAPFS